MLGYIGITGARLRPTSKRTSSNFTRRPPSTRGDRFGLSISHTCSCRTVTALFVSASFRSLAIQRYQLKERSMDYTCWGISELIRELQARDAKIIEWENTLMSALREEDEERVKDVREQMFAMMQESSFNR